jgi:hypothetical protein
MRRLLPLFFIFTALLPHQYSAHGAVLTLTKIPITQISNSMSFVFAPNKDSFYYTEGGGANILREFPISELTATGVPISTTLDGLASFRALNTQSLSLEASSAPGVNGHYWIYGVSGNATKTGLTADGAGTTKSGYVWAIDTSDNSYAIIPLKRSDGKWMAGTVSRAISTPDGRFIYVMTSPSVTYGGSGNEISKISTATNTQVGNSVRTPNSRLGQFFADNTYLYLPTTTGLYRMGVDPSTPVSKVTLSGTAATYDFTTQSQESIIDGKIYLTNTANTVAVIDGVTGAGSTYTISNSYNTGGFWGLRRGVDDCIYAASANNASINRINPRNWTVVASTGTLANFAPYSDSSFLINQDGSRYFIAPKTPAFNGIYVLDIAGSECSIPEAEVSISFSNAPSYGTLTTITATSDAQGRATFTANGKRIPKCIGIRTSGTSPITATCNWKPSIRGSISIQVEFKPDDPANFRSTKTAPKSTPVANRTGRR